MVLDQYLQKYIGDSPVLYMLIGLATLILLNLALTLVIAYKSKTDKIKFEVLPDFIAPLLMYGAFLIAGEAMIIATKGFSYVNEAARGFQTLAFLTIILKYFKQIYAKLKSLGMETSPELDRKLETIIPSDITQVTNTVTHDDTNTIVEGRPEENER